MAKVDVIATRQAKFAKAGTRRSLAANEAKVLVTLGQATYANAGEAPRRGYLRRDMVAQPAVMGAITVPAARADLGDKRTRQPRRTAVPSATTAHDDGEA